MAGQPLCRSRSTCGDKTAIQTCNSDYTIATLHAIIQAAAAQILTTPTGVILARLAVETVMSDRETFGPWLRSERERRGISLDTLASVTKVNADLWEGLERNDFSRWPTGIFARAFVRDYARAIGLDADDVVNEFCRLFSIGDRRSRGLINAQANLIGHKLSYDDSGGLPPQGDRRSKAREDASSTTGRRLRLAPRTLAAILDTTSTLVLSWLLSTLFRLPFAACAAVLVLLYYASATVVFGATPGSWFVAFLKPRVPSLFTVEEQRSAHA